MLSFVWRPKRSRATFMCVCKLSKQPGQVAWPLFRPIWLPFKMVKSWTAWMNIHCHTIEKENRSVLSSCCCLLLRFHTRAYQRIKVLKPEFAYSMRLDRPIIAQSYVNCSIWMARTTNPVPVMPWYVSNTRFHLNLNFKFCPVSIEGQKRAYNSA